MKFVPFESLLVKFWREITVLTNYANYKIMLINTPKSRVYRLVTAKFGFSSSKPTKSTILDKLALKNHKDREKDRSTMMHLRFFNGNKQLACRAILFWSLQEHLFAWEQ